jgi:hypothetical protein
MLLLIRSNEQELNAKSIGPRQLASDRWWLIFKVEAGPWFEQRRDGALRMRLKDGCMRRGTV